LTFFNTRGKLSVPNRTFKAEFKYTSSFSPLPTVFCDSQVKSENRVKTCIFTYFTGQQNLTLFGTRGKISVPNRTYNAELKSVSRISPSPTVFFVTAKLIVQYWSATLYDSAECLAP
jgi:hypothetical protein